MPHFLMQGVSFSGSTFALFAILFIGSYLIYHRYFRFINPVVESGHIVMAMGVFAIACLPAFHWSPFMMLAAALELLIVWLYIAARLMHLYLRERLPLESQADRLSMGTWVASTIMVVLFVDQVESTLHGFIVFLGMLAILIYAIYLVIIVCFIRFIIRKQGHLYAMGTLLLPTVATQSVVLLFSELFQAAIPLYFYQALIVLGSLFYMGGFSLMMRYTFVARRCAFLAVWPNTHHIIYGGMAITGLAMLKSHAFAEGLIMPLWWLSTIFIALVLSGDLIRLAIRMKMKGIRKAIFIYTTSQWARIFTIGMYYAFTTAYYNQEYPENALVKLVADYGQYLVTLLVIIELILVLMFVVQVNRNQRECIR